MRLRVGEETRDERLETPERLGEQQRDDGLSQLHLSSVAHATDPTRVGIVPAR